VLRRIPGLQLQLSEAECCGVAGTYGIKAERYPVAVKVGRDLFAQIDSAQPDIVITDSETCRWWISHHTGVKCMHPLELVHRSLSLPVDPETRPVEQAQN
jgi:glycerol-3-phosphate dehydrogenase subunit C